MDDMNAFERAVADEMARRAGPLRLVDDLGIFHAVNAAAQSPDRRYRSMFTAVRFVAAGAIMALFGGFLLSGVLTTQRAEPAPGAASGDMTSPPVEIIGQAEGQGTCPGEGVAGAQIEVVGGITQYRSYQCHPDTVWSDPRLEGTQTYFASFDNYGEGETGSLDLHIGSFAIHIENDEGGWLMRPALLLAFPGSTGWDGGDGVVPVVFDGEGAYAGLIFVGEHKGGETRGFIIEGDYPPTVEVSPTE